MTLNAEQALQTNYNALVKVAGSMLKAAQEGSATPQDVIEVLDSVVDQLAEIRQEIPGGAAASPEEGEGQAPAVAPPSGASEESEEEGEEIPPKKKVAKADSSIATKQAKEIAELKARLDEAEAYKLAKEREDVAETYADIFPEAVQQAKYDEVINSTEPIAVWETKIAALQEFTQNSVKPAKTVSTWIPQKVAKQQVNAGLKFL